MNIRKTIIAAVVALTLVAVVAPAGTNALTTAELQAQINALMAQLTTLQGGTTATTGAGVPAACAGITFSRNLTVGSNGADVKCLQAVLNLSVTTQVATTGAGSPGNETTTFGPRTLVAVKKFQAENGMIPAAQVGPMTRAKLNSILAGGTTGGGTVVLPPVVTPTGAVTAVLSSTTPAAGALINSQAGANVLDINFVGTGTITSVTLQRSGVSTQNTLSAVYLYDGTTRLTDGYSFNSNGSLTINGISIPVTGSKVISVKVDTASDAVSYASSIAVSLTSYVANGVTSVSNVTGNTFSIVTGSAATAYIDGTSNGASGSSVNSGTTQYTFWSDTVQVNTRTIQLKGANFKVIGSAPTNALANIKLFVDGIDSGVLATIGSIQGSTYAMFVFANPISLATGTHTIDVRADVVTGASRTVQLSLQQAADITLFDSQVGVNLAVQKLANTAFIADAGPSLTIATGTSTVVVDPTFTNQTNITAGSTNATIGKFVIHGYGEDVKVSDLYITPVIGLTVSSGTPSGVPTKASGSACVQGTDCSLANVTVYFNGSQVGTQKNWTGASTSTPLDFSMGSQMIIPAGQDSTLEIKADIQTTDGINYTAGQVAVVVEGQSSANSLGQVSQSSIKFPDTSDVYTSGLTISSGSLVVSKNTALASYTASPNTANVKIGSFVLQNQSTSEAVRLTTLTLALTSNGSTALTSTELTGLSAVKTSDTTGSGATPIQPSSSNTFSVSDVLQPNASMVIDIFANVGSSSLISAVVPRLTVASIGVVSNISSTGTITTGQTVSFAAGSLAAGGVTLVASPTATTPAQFIAGGSGSTSKATFQFVATSAPVTVSEIKIVVTGSDANPTQMITNVCIPNGNGTTTVCAQPAVSSGTQTAYLTGLNFTVSTGSGVTKEVVFSYADVGLSGITPGKSVAGTMTYVKYSTGSTTTTVTPTAANVLTKTIYLASSVPTITVASTGSALNTTTSGATDAAKVTVKAGAQSLKVRQIQFTVSHSGASSAGTYDTTQDSSTTVANYLAVSGVPVAQCKAGSTSGATATMTCLFTDTALYGGTAAYANDYTIPANDSVTFDLYTKFSTGPTLGTATVTQNVTLAKTSDTDVTVSSSTTADGGFWWDDTSTAGGTGYGPYNDYRLFNFPTTSASTHN